MMHVRTRSRTRLLALGAAVLMSFAWIAVAAPRAHAILRCAAAGDACGFINSNFGSNRGNWAGDNTDLSVFTQSNCQKGNWNDCISSLWNNGTSCNITWFWDASFGTPGLLNHLDNGDSDLSNNVANGSTWNDKISSDEWCLA